MGIIQCFNPSTNIIPSSDCHIDTTLIPHSPSTSNSPSLPNSPQKTKIIKPFQKRKFLPRLFLSPTTTMSSASTSQTSLSNLTTHLSNPNPVPLISKPSNTNFKTTFVTTYIDSTVSITEEAARKALNHFHTPSVPQKNNITFQDSVNLIIIGPSKVGKSCFCIRLNDSKFDEAYIPSIGLEVRTRLCRVKQQTKTMNIYAIPSNRQNKENYETLLQTSQIVFVLYDVTSEQSFEEAKKLYEKEFVYKNDKTPKTNLDYINNGFPIVSFIGNKIDLKYEQSLINKVYSYCNDNYVNNYLISTKTAKGIRTLMHSILDKLSSYKF